jgi:hypothetical protein
MMALAPGASSLCVAGGATKQRAAVGAHQTSFMVGSGSAALKSCSKAGLEEHANKRDVSVSVRAKGRRNAGIPGRQPQVCFVHPNLERPKVVSTERGDRRNHSKNDGRSHEE